MHCGFVAVRGGWWAAEKQAFVTLDDSLIQSSRHEAIRSRAIGRRHNAGGGLSVDPVTAPESIPCRVPEYAIKYGGAVISPGIREPGFHLPGC